MSKDLQDEPLSLIDGAIVREKGTDKLYKVIVAEDDFLSYPHSTSVTLTDGEGNVSYHDINTLELVTDKQDILKVKPTVNHELTNHEVDECMEKIEALIKHLVQKYQTYEIGKKLSLKIYAECFGGDRGVLIEHTATVNYDESMTSDNLEESFVIALERYRETENNKPKEIMFHET